MRWLNRLHARYGHYGVPHLTVVLIVGQVLSYILEMSRPEYIQNIAFIPALFLAGEWWRPITFVFSPPAMHPIFAFFFWYLFYFMGTTLENVWGTLRFNLFFLVGYLATVAVAFFNPQQPASIYFVEGSVFLAFAFLFPDFEIRLFFILPVKIKWLAMLTWGFGFFLVLGLPWHGKLMIVASVANFFLFFGKDVWRKLRYGQRRMVHQSQQIKHRERAIHRCVVCGKTEKTDPQMEFRYCSKCAGNPCYCSEHLRSHEHIAATVDAPETEGTRPN